MENTKDGDSFCCGCLCNSEEFITQKSTLQNDVLKTIFQSDYLVLCCFCKRIAQHAELFIKNVQSNQILLENVHNLSSINVNSVRSQCQPVHNLTHFPLEAVNITPNEDICNEECFTVIPYNKKKEIAVKEEFKVEPELLDNLDHLEGEFIDDDNDFSENFVKNETFSFDALLKHEIEIDGIDIKCLRKSVKKKKLSKKNKKKLKEIKQEIEDGNKVKMIYVTKEQCLEERAKKLLEDEQYLESTYKCADCIKGFSFKASYELHLEKHSKAMGDYECDICKQRMDSEDKLLRHKKYHEVRYACTVCGLTRITRTSMMDHYSAFHGNYQYSCPFCSKIFNRQVSLRKHIGYKHKHNERAQCAYCSKSYANKEVLKKHMVDKHPTEVSAVEVQKKHVCQICGKAFKAPSQLKNHNIKHSHRKDFYCVECDKSFKSDYILKHHLKTASPHVNYLELPLPCEHCEKRFAIRRDLERHTNRVHLNVKPFQCDRCEKAYLNSYNLREHKKYSHEGYKRPLKYPCPMCNKIFDRSQILKSHIRTHTGERPYQCSKCPAQFNQASILRTHIKLIHLKLTRDGRPKVAVK